MPSGTFVPFGPYICQVVTSMIWRDKSVSTTMGVHRVDGTPLDEGRLGDIAAIFQDSWQTDLAPILSAGIALVAVEARRLTTRDDLIVTVVPDEPIPGEDTGPAVTNQVSLVVTLKTNQAGRSHRGRNYIAGIPLSKVVENNVDAAFRTAVQTAYIHLAANLEGLTTDYELVVLSREEAGAPRTFGVYTAIQAFQVNARVDTQRRRLPR